MSNIWEKIKRVYCSGLLFATTAFIMTFLIFILTKKKVVVYENNKYILWTELILTAGLIGFALERTINAIGGL